LKIELISVVRSSVVVWLYSPMVVLDGCLCLMVRAVIRVLSFVMAGSPVCDPIRLSISASDWVMSSVISVSVRFVCIMALMSAGVL